MEKSAGSNRQAIASIRLAGEELRVERLQAAENGQEQLRFSIWEQDRMLGDPLLLTEQELISLLQAAIQAGVLSSDFLSKLESFHEI